MPGFQWPVSKISELNFAKIYDSFKAKLFVRHFECMSFGALQLDYLEDAYIRMIHNIS